MPHFRSQRYAPMFSARSFMVLYFTFWSIIHFELVKYWSRFIIYTGQMDVQFFQHHLETFFNYLPLYFFQKQVDYDAVYFWTLFHSFMYSFNTTILHYLDYCNFILNFKLSSFNQFRNNLYLNRFQASNPGIWYFLIFIKYSLIYFISVFQLSAYLSCAYFVRFVPKYIILLCYKFYCIFQFKFSITHC